MNNRGYLLLAIGQPAYYKYALNLARSLKTYEPAIPIALIMDEGINHEELKPYRDEMDTLFDHYIPCADRWIYGPDGIHDYMRPKVFLYEATPFEETNYIDVDTIAIDNFVRKWVPTGKEYPFIAQCYTNSTMQSDGNDSAYHYWVSPRKIRNKYGLYDGQILPQISTTFLAFRKHPDVEAMFNKAIELHDEEHKLVTRNGRYYPDEYFFNVACAITRLSIPIQTYVYWHFIHGMMGATYEDRLHAISSCGLGYITLGGSDSPDYALTLYNKEAIKVAQRSGVPTIFAHKKDGTGNILIQDSVDDEKVKGVINDFMGIPQVINIEHRKDRLANFKRMADMIGLRKWERIDAVTPMEGKQPEGMTKGSYGCMLSHQLAIAKARVNKWSRVMVFEDDATTYMPPETEGLSPAAYMLYEHLRSIPDDWDIIMFGGFHQLPPIRKNDTYKVVSTYSTHAMLYRESVYDIVENLGTDAPFDVMLSQHYKKLKVYTCDPNAPIFWQLNGYSDIKNKDVDYSVLRSTVGVHSASE